MSFPLIPLEAIPTHGLSVKVQEWARVAVGEGLGGTPTAVGGQLEVSRTGRRIAVSGTLSGAALSLCDRCGELLALDVAGPVDCVYLPSDEIAAAAVDEEPPADGPDSGEYDGVALDLVHVVREFFALERPARLLCADLDPAADPSCLARFRVRAGVGPSEPDPRLAVLKGVKPPR